MSEEALNKLFLHEKPARIMIGLKGPGEKYASLLMKEADCTYTHTLKILSVLEEHGLIESSKEGRKKPLKLTDKGEDIAHLLEGLYRQLERVSKPGREEAEDKEDEPEDT